MWGRTLFRIGCVSTVDEDITSLSNNNLLQGDNIVESKPHQCPPNFAKNELQKRIQECKHTCASSNVPSVTQTYNKMASKLKDSGMD